METPIAIVVLGLVGALVGILIRSVSRAVRPSSVWRLRLPGVILVGLGVALLGSQLPAGPERVVNGVVLLLGWGGIGLALIVGTAWSRTPGLVLSGIGFAVASWVTLRADAWANEIGRSADRVLVDVFFLADGPHFTWIEVSLASLAFAGLSAIAGAFLILAPAHLRGASAAGPRPTG